MRTLLLSLTVAVATLSLSAFAGHAGGLKPGYYAHAQLVYANGWALYDAGCLRWMPHVRSWYNVCQVADQRSPVLVTKY
jgi:hypothetical protein